MENLKIEAKAKLIEGMKKSLSETHSLPYYTKNIIKSMNALEDLLGKMMSDIDADFESKFWLAAYNADLKSLKQLNALINLTIDNIRAGR